MSIYTQTPLRVSFFGGGSDYKEYFTENEGAVLGSSINKYIYIFELPMSSFSPKKFKLSYRKTEEVDHPKDFKHPVVSSVLCEMNWTHPINISTMSDLPGGTGLGSSSAFSVGLLKLMNCLTKNNKDNLSLAKEAFRIEHDVLNENVGFQDHLHASFGGLNLYRLSGNKVTIEPIQLKDSFRSLLNKSLIMVYTGQHRHASTIVADQINATKNKLNTEYINELVDLTIHCANALQTNSSDTSLLKDLGLMLQRSWELKKSFSSKITNSSIDEIYEKGMALGALGGKLCGAGGGGFVLFIVEEEKHFLFRDNFDAMNVMNISLTNSGTFVKEI